MLQKPKMVKKIKRIGETRKAADAQRTDMLNSVAHATECLSGWHIYMGWQ